MILNISTATELSDKKDPGIHLLFELEESKNRYTKNALLLQDILRYKSTLEPPYEFKIQQLGNWLVDNNEEFQESRREIKRLQKREPPRSQIIQNRRGRIEACVDFLAELGFVEFARSVQAERNTSTQTKVFRFTKWSSIVKIILAIRKAEGFNHFPFRHTTGLDIESRKRLRIMAEENLEPLCKQLYQEVLCALRTPEEVHADDEKPSIVIFAEKMLEVLKAKRLIVNYAVCIVSQLHTKYPEIGMEDVYTLFVKNLALPSSDNPLFRLVSDGSSDASSLNWIIWRAAYDRLDKTTQAIVLSDMKVLFEHERKIHTYNRTFETKRFEMRADETKVVLNLYCSNSEPHLQPYVIDTREAIRLALLAEQLNTRCVKCGMTFSSQVLVFSQ